MTDSNPYEAPGESGTTQLPPRPSRVVGALVGIAALLVSWLVVEIGYQHNVPDVILVLLFLGKLAVYPLWTIGALVFGVDTPFIPWTCNPGLNLLVSVLTWALVGAWLWTRQRV